MGSFNRGSKSRASFSVHIRFGFFGLGGSVAELMVRFCETTFPMKMHHYAQIHHTQTCKWKQTTDTTQLH